MLERVIPPQLSAQIVDLLIKRRGWSVKKIAKKIDASEEYVLRVRRGQQGLDFADVETLAGACRQDSHLLAFEAMHPRRMSAEQRELYELTRKVVESHKQFAQTLRRKPRKNRRSRAKAA